jgi:hypothetical protein
VLIYIARRKRKSTFEVIYSDILSNPVEVFHHLPGPSRHTWVLSFTVDSWIPSRY